MKIKNVVLSLFFCVILGIAVYFALHNLFPQQTSVNTLPKNLYNASPKNVEMMKLLNEVRTMNKLPSLQEDERLNKSAKAKACDMQEKNYFTHEDPEGRLPFHLFAEAGYPYEHAGENMVHYTEKPIEDMFHLMSSPEHRENILKPEFKDVGIGICGEYLVQHFGSQQ